MFHSAPSILSTDTKVGSPPCVKRTSPACNSASTNKPNARIFCHSISLKGLVTRGSSNIRVTYISTSRLDSQMLVMPVMGAAEVGVAETASGICPSPVNNPDVASKPTQPAPGI